MQFMIIKCFYKDVRCAIAIKYKRDTKEIKGD